VVTHSLQNGHLFQIRILTESKQTRYPGLYEPTSTLRFTIVIRLIRLTFLLLMAG
jgi:hypothetical protein